VPVSQLKMYVFALFLSLVNLDAIVNEETLDIDVLAIKGHGFKIPIDPHAMYLTNNIQPIANHGGVKSAERAALY
jgi:hypothetical protein